MILIVQNSFQLPRFVSLKAILILFTPCPQALLVECEMYFIVNLRFEGEQPSIQLLLFTCHFGKENLDGNPSLQDLTASKPIVAFTALMEVSPGCPPLVNYNSRRNVRWRDIMSLGVVFLCRQKDQGSWRDLNWCLRPAWQLMTWSL